MSQEQTLLIYFLRPIIQNSIGKDHFEKTYV